MSEQTTGDRITQLEKRMIDVEGKQDKRVIVDGQIISDYRFKFHVDTCEYGDTIEKINLIISKIEHILALQEQIKVGAD